MFLWKFFLVSASHKSLLPVSMRKEGRQQRRKPHVWNTLDSSKVKPRACFCRAPVNILRRLCLYLFASEEAPQGWHRKVRAVSDLFQDP